MREDAEEHPVLRADPVEEVVDRRKWAMGVKRYAMARKRRVRVLVASCVE